MIKNLTEINGCYLKFCKRPLLLAMIVLTFFAFVVWPNPANAQLKVDVTRGKVEAFSIGLTRLDTGNPTEADYARNIIKVVENDLRSSGLFKPQPPENFMGIRTDISIMPKFSAWQAFDVEGALIGRLALDNKGQIVAEFRLWDLISKKQMVGRRLITERENWRQMAHMIADTIYSRITGEEGYFNTRLVYIAETGRADRRVKRLAIMDYDGANHRYLTDGSYLVLTPRFSPNQQMITYLSYENGKPEVFVYNLNSGQKSAIGNFPGMTFAPRFTPEGDHIIMSLARNGNTDIYRMNLRSRQMTRLTNTRAIETSPSYSPDGRKIVFESDRGGNQQLYVMNADGSGPQRITFGSGRYANPVWSPRGDLIAFTRMYRGKFYIGVIRPDGTAERLITQAHHVEGPTWAPNGRVLMYFKEQPVGRRQEQRKVRIYRIDLTGTNETEINTPGDGSDPAWSPVVR